MAKFTKENDEKTDALAWIGLLGPPIVWIVNLEIIYANVLTACASKSKITLIFSCLVSLALIAGCTLLSRREFSVEPKHEARRFMAGVGLMDAVIFTLITIAQTAAILIIDPCLM
jgi:hypothetical protein